MRMTGDVKCYHCGHISGQVEGERSEDDKLVLQRFTPRAGPANSAAADARRLRCGRCQGPVFVEDLRPAASDPIPMVLPQSRQTKNSPKPRAA
jgi:hypothetical protein